MNYREFKEHVTTRFFFSIGAVSLVFCIFRLIDWSLEIMFSHSKLIFPEKLVGLQFKKIIRDNIC